MEITPELIEKMKRDHRERFNEELTDQEAIESWKTLYDAFSTLLKWDRESQKQGKPD